MLTRYIHAAMQRGRLEWLPKDRVWYGEIPGLPGMWAAGATEAEARESLREVLGDWIAVVLAHHGPLPPVDGSAPDDWTGRRSP